VCEGGAVAALQTGAGGVARRPRCRPMRPVRGSVAIRVSALDADADCATVRLGRSPHASDAHGSCNGMRMGGAMVLSSWPRGAAQPLQACVACRKLHEVGWAGRKPWGAECGDLWVVRCVGQDLSGAFVRRMQGALVAL